MRKNRRLNSNYLIASVVSILNIGMRRRLRFIKIVKTIIAIRLLRILYKEGVIRTFTILEDNDIILVYFKYTDSINLCMKLSLISKPSNRAYWNLNKLAKSYNNNSFTSFYIVSTPQGLVTTDFCLLQGHISGEVLIKVELA